MLLSPLRLPSLPGFSLSLLLTQTHYEKRTIFSLMGFKLKNKKLSSLFALSWGVWAGAAAMAPPSRRSGSWPPANRGSAPRRPRPSPHTRGWPAPHGRWRQHPPGWAKASGRWPRSWCQHSCGSDLLTINLASIHVFQGFLSIIWVLKLHISITFREVWI